MELSVRHRLGGVGEVAWATWWLVCEKRSTLVCAPVWNLVRPIPFAVFTAVPPVAFTDVLSLDFTAAPSLVFTAAPSLVFTAAPSCSFYFDHPSWRFRAGGTFHPIHSMLEPLLPPPDLQPRRLLRSLLPYLSSSPPRPLRLSTPHRHLLFPRPAPDPLFPLWPSFSHVELRPRVPCAFRRQLGRHHDPGGVSPGGGRGEHVSLHEGAQPAPVLSLAP